MMCVDGIFFSTINPEQPRYFFATHPQQKYSFFLSSLLAGTVFTNQ